MILELRHKSLHTREDSVDRALDVQSRLTRWANDVQDALMGFHSDENNIRGQEDCATANGEGPAARYKILMLVLQHESTIALNRPLLAKKPASPASQAALQACIQSSRAIIETVHKDVLSDQIIDQNDAATRSVTVWPLLTWSVWMGCFILTYAALEGGTSSSSALSYAKRTLQILRKLSRRGTAWPDSCAQAVDHLIAALQKRSSTTSVEGNEKLRWSDPGTTSVRTSQSGNKLDDEQCSNDTSSLQADEAHSRAAHPFTTRQLAGETPYFGGAHHSSGFGHANTL